MHLEKQLINLKDDLLKNFDELSIKYKGIEIKNNIFFTSGFLVCHGVKDIANKDNIVEINIPENSKWLDFKIVSKSKGIGITNIIDDNKLILQFDLFKSKEFIEYESILEINQGEEKEMDMSKLLNFHHRIPNIPSIDKLSIQTLKSGLTILFYSLIMAFPPTLVGFGFNEIETYELNTYNSVTNEVINNYTIYSNKSINEFKTQITNEASGFILYLNGKTQDFPVNLVDNEGKEIKEIKSIYFKMNNLKISEWIYSIFLSLLLILSILGIFTSITLFYYQKRYLKYILN